MALQRPPLSMLRIKQVVAQLSISKSNIYERLNPRSPRYDASFPKPVKLGNSTVFFAHEIDAFILSKVAGSRRANADHN
jgi:prophage regulatory protein